MVGQEQKFIQDTKDLIDALKAISSNNGLGGDGNEFKIIVQVFLYKFLNDKFMYETKKVEPKLAQAEKWEDAIASMSDDEYQRMLLKLPATSASLKKEHFLSYLYNKCNEPDFYKTFDNTLLDIASHNSDIFSIETDQHSKIVMFEGISKFILDDLKKNDFCKAIVNRLLNFSFEGMFEEKYDFFSTIFEYLIKDYNKDGGGVYAEYYTPRSVARILSSILVDGNPQKVDCYDPSAGSGTLLMSVAHAIGEDRCTIYSQDISQKSSNMLRLNLILNNLILSLQNIVQGNTILNPIHREPDGTIKKFDYIVSNPPFKLDFSDFRDALDTPANSERFFAGIPSIPKNKKEAMAIYLLFIQHIMYSLKPNGKAAIVVPTGFITAQSGIEKAIRERMIEKKMLKGVVSMPSNIFATTGTNVSVIFLDKSNTEGQVVLVDASKLGTKVKEGKNQKTLLSTDEEQKIIDTFKKKEAIDDFSVVVSYDEIAKKNYSFSAGQYFDVKIEYVDMTPEEFKNKMDGFKTTLNDYFTQSKQLEDEINKQLGLLKYE